MFGLFKVASTKKVKDWVLIQKLLESVKLDSDSSKIEVKQNCLNNLDNELHILFHFVLLTQPEKGRTVKVILKSLNFKWISNKLLKSYPKWIKDSLRFIFFSKCLFPIKHFKMLLKAWVIIHINKYIQNICVFMCIYIQIYI